jgi:DNA polymerase/3'-5' exonuclease PolX
MTEEAGMSSTDTRVPLDEAARMAEGFRDLFPESSYLRWEVAGSVRRRVSTVGDIEHVVIPRRGECTPDGAMFPVEADLVLAQLDSLLAEGRIEKAVYPDGKHRWGERYRGVMWHGVRHEVFIADAENWGSLLTIRTGPWEFSKRLVTQLYARGWHHEKGYVRYLRGKCEGEVCPCPDEARFFEMAGEAWKAPEYRQ